MENLALLAQIAFIIMLTPIISRVSRLPVSVVEILFGSLAAYFIFIDSSNELFKNLSKIGFLYLMFLAGLEIDIKKFLKSRDMLLKKALIYFGMLYSLSFLIYSIFDLNPIYLVALPIVSLGMIMAMINEHGKEHQWLELALVIGILGELISIVAIVIYDGALTFGLGFEFYKTIFYLVSVLVMAVILYRLLKVLFWWYPELKLLIMPDNDARFQSVRFSIAIFFVMISIMYFLELDMVLGAFIAGLFISNFFEHQKELPHALSTLGFGFLVPMFFIYVGSTLDLEVIFTYDIFINSLWIMVAMVVIRQISSFVAYHSRLGTKATILFGLGDSMPLTFLIAIATIGYQAEAITQNEYFSFVVASLLEGIIIMTIVKIILNYKQKDSLNYEVR